MLLLSIAWARYLYAALHSNKQPFQRLEAVLTVGNVSEP